MKCAFCVLLLIGLVSSQTCRLRYLYNIAGPRLIPDEKIPSKVMNVFREELASKQISPEEIVCVTKELHNGGIYRFHYKGKDAQDNVEDLGFQVSQDLSGKDIPLDK